MQAACGAGWTRWIGVFGVALALAACAGAVEAPGDAPICGDGVLQRGELCDGDLLGELTCSDLDPATVGTPRCTAQCTVDLAPCTLPVSVEPVPEPQPDGETMGVGNVVGALDWQRARDLAADDPRQPIARASGRIDYSDGGGSYRCSATLIAADLLATNHHCAPDAAAAATVRFRAETETGGAGTLSFRCPELVFTDCGHDVSVLRCEREPYGDRLPGELYGWAPIALDPPAAGDRIDVIHTNCDYRDQGDPWCTPVKLVSPGRVSRYGAECITFSGERTCGNCRSEVPHARHDADTLGGSSGGGVFDAASHALIGLNWGGVVAPDDTGGHNFFASLGDLVDRNPQAAAVLRPLAEVAPEPEPDEVFEPEPEPEPVPEPLGGAACVIISEYVEGRGYDKAIELRNCGDETMALATVTVCLESNGRDAAAEGCSAQLTLAGALAPDAVITLCHPDADLGVPCDVVDRRVTNFNGDDRLILLRTGTAVGDGAWFDVFGEAGVAPGGRPWADVTLRRVDDTPHREGAFPLHTLFDAYPLGTVDGLGD